MGFSNSSINITPLLGNAALLQKIPFASYENECGTFHVLSALNNDDVGSHPIHVNVVPTRLCFKFSHRVDEKQLHFQGN